MITALLGILAPVLGKVLDRIPNPVEREKVRLEMEAQIRAQEIELVKLMAQADGSQAEINKVEAGSSNLFVSGWRPAVGWICALGMGWTFVFQPFLDWGLAIWKPGVVTPALDSSQLMSLLFGLLGMGAMRSYDKLKGTAK